MAQMNIDATIEELRNERFRHLPLRYNCIGKSFRLRKMCHDMGVGIRVVIALCLIPNVRFRFLPPALPLIHGWAEIKGKRVELARPLSETNSLWSYDIDIAPLVGIWI